MLRMSDSVFRSYQIFTNAAFKYFNKKISFCTMNSLITSKSTNPFTDKTIDFKDLIVIDMISILSNHEYEPKNIIKTRIMYSVCKEIMYRSLVINIARYFEDDKYAYSVEQKVRYLTYRYLIDNKTFIAKSLFKPDVKFLNQGLKNLLERNKGINITSTPELKDGVNLVIKKGIKVEQD